MSPMTADDRRLIRTSFDALRDMASPVALLFYGRLFEVDPSARRLFHIDLAVQAQKIMTTLDWVVKSLDEFESMRPALADLGRQHADYGVRPEQYETVTSSLMWAFAHALGPDFDAATHSAWKRALSAVSAAMLEGTGRPPRT